MKLRQAQTSATYILPDPGELDKRVTIRLRVDEPDDDFGVSPRIRMKSVPGQRWRNPVLLLIRAPCRQRTP